MNKRKDRPFGIAILILSMLVFMLYAWLLAAGRNRMYKLTNASNHKTMKVASSSLLIFILLFSAANSTLREDASALTQTIVEGKHVRFFLYEQTTSLIPDTAISSKWLLDNPGINGAVRSSEWWEAARITDNLKSPLFGNLRGDLFVKNNKEYLFLGIIASSDKSNNEQGDWVEVSFFGFGPKKANSSSVTYRIDAGEKSFTMKYTATKDGKKIQTFTSEQQWKRVRAEAGASYDDGRMYELKVWLKDPNLPIENGKTLYMKINVNDGSIKNTCKACVWQLGLSPGKDKVGSAKSFKQLVEERIIPRLDRAYETFQSLTNFKPHENEKIDILFSHDAKMESSGNPVIVTTQKFLPALIINNLPDTYLYPFINRMAYSFIPPSSPLALPQISPAFADLMTYHFFREMKLPHDDSFGSRALNKYQTDGNPFGKIVWSDGKSSNAEYPARALIYQMMKKIQQKEGFKVYTSLATMKIANSPPKDEKTSLSLFIHSLSKAAGKNLVQNFTSLNFPVISPAQLFDFELGKMQDVKIAQGESLSTNVKLTLSKWLPRKISLSAKGLPEGAQATFSSAKVEPPAEVKVTISTSPGTKVGKYPVTIVAVGEGKNKTSTFNLDVRPLSDLLKLDAKLDKNLKPIGAEFKFTASIKNNTTSQVTTNIGLFIDNKLVKSQNYTLAKGQGKPVEFIWSSKGIDPKVLHTAQIKILSGDKTVVDSNKVKFGVFKPREKGSVQNKSVTLVPSIAKDPDTKKNYTLAKIDYLKIKLITKNTEKLNLKLIAPNGKVIVGKDGIVNSPTKVVMNLDLDKVMIHLSYTGSKSRTEVLTLKPLEQNKQMPAGAWKILVDGADGKVLFKLSYVAKYKASSELTKGFT